MANRIRFEPITISDFEFSSWFGAAADIYFAAVVDRRNGAKAAMIVSRLPSAKPESDDCWVWQVSSEDNYWVETEGLRLEEAMREAENVILSEFDHGYKSWPRAAR